MISNSEYVARLGRLYNRILALKSDDDFVVNQPQMEKLVEVLDFFLDMEKKSENNKVEPVSLIPREEHGGVTATFLVFDIFGDEIQRFCNVIRHTSALTIDSTEDGICISVTVPKVFMPKK